MFNYINIINSRLSVLGNINRGSLSSITVYFDNLKSWFKILTNLISFVYKSFKTFNLLKTLYFNNINIFNFFVLYFVNICPVGSLLNNFTGGLFRSWDVNFFPKLGYNSINYTELKFKRFIYNLI